MQGAQILSSEAYLDVHSNGEGCSATPHMNFYKAISLCIKAVQDKIKDDAPGSLKKMLHPLKTAHLYDTNGRRL
jgi:hypothetical protein